MDPSDASESQLKEAKRGLEQAAVRLQELLMTTKMIRSQGHAAVELYRGAIADRVQADLDIAKSLLGGKLETELGTSCSPVEGANANDAFDMCE